MKKMHWLNRFLRFDPKMPFIYYLLFYHNSNGKKGFRRQTKYKFLSVNNFVLWNQYMKAEGK